jgi:hypothetical protein
MDLVLDEFASYSPEERATYLRYVQQARRGTIPGTGSVRTFRAPSVRRDFQAKLNTARGVSVDDGCNVGLEFTLLPDASPRQSSSTKTPFRCVHGLHIDLLHSKV